MRVAVVGSGISGPTCAYYLSKHHEVTVFEASRRIGGHTATVDVQLGPRKYAIDTGFIAYNDWTYPNFINLLNEIGVSSKPTSMGFSVKDAASGLEYSDYSLRTLFAQKRNLLSPKFLRMVLDIASFNKQALKDLELGHIQPHQTLESYRCQKGFSDSFKQWYLTPMASAIWSTPWRDVDALPALFVLRLFKSHGLLSMSNRPQWRVVDGGSREYLGPLTARFADRIITNAPVKNVLRRPDRVQFTAGGVAHEFDQIVIATHSDQALAMLADPTPLEDSILGAIPYQRNHVVLHTDSRLLPANRAAWASWNYTLKPKQDRAVVTYNMNLLQGLQSPETFCVTLNNKDDINPHRILGEFYHEQPIFSLNSALAQKRWGEINGMNNTWYCGAYWHSGLHEDGVCSALRIAQTIPERQQAAA